MMIMITFTMYSCKQWSVPNELVGEWKSSTVEITVRIKDEKGNFKFIKDTADIHIKIYQNNIVDGKIGIASFDNARIVKNAGLPPSITGTAYIIKDIEINKIFKKDPLDKKSIELWLSPLKGDTLEVEIRYTSNLSQFPMSGFTLIKNK